MAMIVTKNTKISKLIIENKDVIDAIASINKNFLKFKNPVLRRVLASRVRVKDAARIGKVNINTFLKKLEIIGFKVEYTTHENTHPKMKNNTIINKNSLTIITLDVRPTIEFGEDPFKEIMKAVKTLKNNETLKIINVFEPIPLINLLKGKGYKTWTDTINNNEYHTFFTKNSESKKDIENPIEIEGDFSKKLKSFGDNFKEIDVRLLEMPEPMTTILEALEKLNNNQALLVHHKKVPQFLLPELKTRNYKWMSKQIEEGYTLFIIFK